MKEKTSVLFVCMGNICRSPTAEGVFRKLAEERGLADKVHIDSAGTHGYHIGDPPDARSCAHAARRGYDLSSLRARKVDAADFARFDYVLAMDESNLALLEAACADEYRKKLGLFMKFASRSGSRIVPDPYYGGAAGFDMVLDYVEDAAEGLLDAIMSAQAIST
ncbi:MAG: low molecular weight phosphotyrosine protein phosphatase [Paucimonas sp.]|jgi:protein-tyrosine phosphatase|nr:low molecular weight phosphotyrosine protein phosphatase [Paucimonas sp.]